MNRVWPGQTHGSTSSQMAYNLYQQAIRHANYVIDLHTASSHYLLHVVYGAGDHASRELAEVFGLDLLLEEEVDQKLKEARFQGKLRNVLITIKPLARKLITISMPTTANDKK